MTEQELHLQAGMVTLTVLPGSHRSPVMQVDLKRTMQRVVSCSKNSFTSLAIRHIRHEASGTSALPSVVLRNAPVNKLALLSISPSQAFDICVRRALRALITTTRGASS